MFPLQIEATVGESGA